MTLKRTSIFRLAAFLALAIVIYTATARNPIPNIIFFEPGPDSPTAALDTFSRGDTAIGPLKFPIYDKTGEPMTDNTLPKSIDLKDPANEKKTFEYDADSNKYFYNNTMGREFLRNPTYLTLDEYLKYRGKQDDDAYWQRRLDALMMFKKKPELPQMYKEGLFDRIFGGSSISVKPQGNVDITMGGVWQNIKNPTLVQRAQKYGIFDFDMQMNINLLATIGDKMKLNISNNTKATFDYQNMQKIDYNGKEDEMIKKIEAGNISFPLKSNLISGVQSLFGIKTQLQFGKLWVTGVISQQKSQRKSLTLQGGAQAQQFMIKADAYEENKNFLLAQYFHDHYNEALATYPKINSQIIINKVEIWVTNRTGAVTGVRSVLAFQDLGEVNPYTTTMKGGTSFPPMGMPDNNCNRLYTQMVQNPKSRQQSNASNTATDLGLVLGQDFEKTTARQLSSSEYYLNAQLGYVMLRTQMNPDDVCGIAYRYTYKGKVYQVGEFAEDLPPDTTNSKVIFLKLLKGTSNRPYLPVWDLMMKNVYTLGGYGITKDNFTLNIMYQDPGGTEKRFFPEGSKQGVPFISLLNLDRLNAQNEEQPDGIFDFVEGTTVNLQQGKIIFPVLEPFGTDLANAVDATANPLLRRRYIYQVLYDSTKTIAMQSQNLNRYLLRGTYKSSSSAEIFLGGFNIPQGSVSVTAGGTRLVENQDYQIEYGLGRIKIINAGILSSGVPINIQYEDNSTFGFQQQNFMGARFDYYYNKHLTLGGTLMRLNERPFTQKVSFGEDPIKNTVLGIDLNYQNEVPALTRALNVFPKIYTSTSSSFVNVSGEVAGILPGHPKQINALDPEGAVYVDDFEGTTSSYDMRFPAISWSLASTPFGAINPRGQKLFPEAALSEKLEYGMNRAKIAWYNMEPTLVDPGTGAVPGYVKNDSNQHYVRMVMIKDVFPNRPIQGGFQNSLSTFDLGYYPNQRGPYNFDVANVDDSGLLKNPTNRWGGIMRAVDNTDFEASNVQFIQFWLMDPFLNKANPDGGQLYINLGSVSEDVLKDSRMSFENGIPNPFDSTKLDSTIWGYTPRFQQQITRAFDNDPAVRASQDVGYDELNDAREYIKYYKFLSQLGQKLGTSSNAYKAALLDPASDNYKYFRGDFADNVSVLGRYKGFNNPEGNSPVTDPNSSFATSATTIPESEDINRDNTLNEAENYFQYRVDLRRGMDVGSNYIISKQVSQVKLPNGTTEDETWYQFKIPIRNYDTKVGGISDFRSIRFMRMFLTGWQDSTFLRFASLELGRSQWRSYNYSLNTPGENLPQQNTSVTDFTVTSVSIEENASRRPINYVIPPGVNRQLTAGQNGVAFAQNEQSISLRTCALQDGDARAVFKEVNIDMRQFNYLRMFIHAESQVDQMPIKDADVMAFIRLGSDFTNNYYEYRKPMAITQPTGTNTSESVWPEANQMNITLQELVDAKKERDAKGIPYYIPYVTKDSKGNEIVVLGNPNIGGVKTMMLGVMNPKKTNQTPGDDGLAKCSEIWFDEMRMAGTRDIPGYAAAGKVAVQLADLGSVNLSGSMHTIGYGSIDQKIQQRSQEEYYQYNASSNLNLGKLLPRKWGVQLPFYVGYTQNVSTPKYNPYNQDVLLTDAMSTKQNQKQADSLRAAAQDFTSITSFNFTNVRINGNNSSSKSKKMPWSIKNFDFSYAYNNQFKHNPLVALDLMNTQRGGFGYNYNVKTKTIEPFKKIIKSKSKWYGLVKDFNFNPLPSTIGMRNELNRVSQQSQVRNVGDATGYELPSTFYKNFTWMRNYNTRWELTKSLSFDYTASNTSRVNEPYGRIDQPKKRDSLWSAIATFGKNNIYTQTFNSSYNVPLSKLPITDWMNLRLNYSTNYTWTTAPPAARSLGNTIGNTSNKTVVGDLNLNQLYSKWRWMRAINVKPTKKPKSRSDKATATKIEETNKDAFTSGAPTTKQVGASAITPKLLPGGKSMSGEIEDGNNIKTSTSAGGSSAGVGASAGGGASAGAGVKGTNNNTSKSLDTNTNAALGKNKYKGYGNVFANVNTANMSEAQLDSLVDLQKELDKRHAKEEKIKKKKARIAARKARRAKLPELNGVERVAGHILTMVNRVSVNYTETGSTTLPGYMDSTSLMGINNFNLQPGLNFVYGYQPDGTWLSQKAGDRKLSTDSLFNSQFQQTYSSNLSGNATIVPFKDFRIDLSLSKSFSKTHSELYKDTGTGVFNSLNPIDGGSFNVSYIATKIIFNKTGVNSDLYNQFLNNRSIISRRLGASNPYTNGLPDPIYPGYSKGYTPYSQDVLIPSFIAGFTGKSAEDQALIDYNHKKVSNNPFRFFAPMPNWRVSYTGLTKFPAISKYFNNFIVNHNFTGTMAMNSFNSSLVFQDLYGLGFPSFIDSNSQNFIPYFQVPNLTLTQAFSPLIGIDAALKNNLTAKFEIRKSKTISLSMIDYQLSENESTEYVVGLGFRKKGIKLPFKLFGATKLKNELIAKVDIGLRDDKNSNTFLANNLSVVSRGQKVIRISPTVDYSVNQKLTLRFFFDRQQSIPYVSTSFPTSNTKAGVTFRFIFGQ